MSLIRYKPVASDRMAAMWTLSQVRDAALVDYGPFGTTVFAKRKLGNMGVDTGNIVSTHLSEDEIIMGDVGALERALLELDRERSCPLIIVVPSSILLATGADIPGVCRYMRERIRARLLCYAALDGDGDYTRGLRAAYTLLVQSLCKKAETQPRTCNLLGLSASSPTAEADAAEVSALLRRAFGMETLLSLGLPCQSADFERAGAAEVNVVLRFEALEAAEWMERELGIPYVCCPPYGYEGTARFLKLVGEAAGLEPPAELLESLSRRAAEARLPGARTGFAIMGDWDLADGLSRFASSMGVGVRTAVCEHEPPSALPEGTPVRFYETEKAWLDVLGNLHGCLILGDERVGYCAPKDNAFLICSNGELAPRGAYRGPLMGPAGADFLLERLRAYEASGRNH